MAATRLFPKSTSTYIYLCILVIIQTTNSHTKYTSTATYSNTVTASSSSSTSSRSTEKQSLQQQAEDKQNIEHQNRLIDDVEHEEFIDGDSNQPHSRKKRLVWITDDGRLALPPGTSLTFTPTIAMPLVRHPPEGFFSNVSISFPVTIDFDKLGLTDNQNPLGDLPPIFARSFGHTAGKMLGEYVSRYLHYKRKRDLTQQSKPSYRTNSRFVIKEDESAENEVNKFPELPERFKHIFHGGERVMLYGVLEDFLSTFGLNGKACLLRTICEVHSRNLEHFGVFGEITKLFLTVTKSRFSDLIPEYVQAQEIGEGRQAPGECFPYHKECPKSIFKALQRHKYSETEIDRGEYHEQEAAEILPQDMQDRQQHDDIKSNEIKFKASKGLQNM